LRLLDHLLLAAKLHRRIHLDGQTSIRCSLELLAHLNDRFYRRIAERMHVGRLEHELLLREGRAGCQSRGEEHAGGCGRNASLDHEYVPPWVRSRARPIDLVPPCVLSGHMMT
jgi:hypothetical protein